MFLYKSATSQEKITNPIHVTKHGSHNQQSHAGGRGRGGGTGSARANATRSRNDSLVNQSSEKVNNLRIDISDLNDETSGNFIENLSDDDQNIIDSVVDNLEEAEGRLNDAYNSVGTKSHLDVMETALVRLDDAYDGLKNADNKELKDFMNNVDNIITDLETFYGDSLGR